MGDCSNANRSCWIMVSDCSYCIIHSLLVIIYSLVWRLLLHCVVQSFLNKGIITIIIINPSVGSRLGGAAEGYSSVCIHTQTHNIVNKV